MPLTVDFIETKSENLIFDAEVIKCKVNVIANFVESPYFLLSVSRGLQHGRDFLINKVLLGFSCFYVSSLR